MISKCFSKQILSLNVGALSIYMVWSVRPILLKQEWFEERHPFKKWSGLNLIKINLIFDLNVKARSG